MKIKTPKRPRMVRTVVLQATREMRGLKSREIGWDLESGLLTQLNWATTCRYGIMRIVSDSMEPER